MSKAIKESSKYEQYSRIDIIGQNGNDGLHYNKSDENDAISYIEKHYPETAKEFQQLQYEQYALFCREAQNEPTIDAFKDLACYGIIAQIVQNGKWGK